MDGNGLQITAFFSSLAPETPQCSSVIAHILQPGNPRYKKKNVKKSLSL